MVQQHLNETGSLIAKKILRSFNEELKNFKQVCPKEMLNKLSQPINSKPKILEAI